MPRKLKLCGYRSQWPASVQGSQQSIHYGKETAHGRCSPRFAPELVNVSYLHSRCQIPTGNNITKVCVAQQQQLVKRRLRGRGKCKRSRCSRKDDAEPDIHLHEIHSHSYLTCISNLGRYFLPSPKTLFRKTTNLLLTYSDLFSARLVQ